MNWRREEKSDMVPHLVSYSKQRIALATVLTLALLLMAAPSVLADEVGGHVNSARSGQLPLLASADRLAGASAAAQAASGKVFHTGLSSLLGTCDSVGEVVGAGPDVPSVFSAFRQSGSHWNIITNPAWTAMGTGRATGSDGMVYVSVVFCRQAGVEPPAVEPPAVEPPAVEPPAVEPPAATTQSSSGGAPAVQAIAEVSAQEPILDEPPPLMSSRRAEIGTILDRQAKLMLPEWSVKGCENGDRGQVPDGLKDESETCPTTS